MYRDPQKVMQILVNIVKNGIESMPNGGQLIVKSDKSRTYAQVRVIDKGVGMSTEQIRRLGRPFYSTKATGTGIGLMTSGTA